MPFSTPASPRAGVLLCQVPAGGQADRCPHGRDESPVREPASRRHGWSFQGVSGETTARRRFDAPSFEQGELLLIARPGVGSSERHAVVVGQGPTGKSRSPAGGLTLPLDGYDVRIVRL
jgi:hypothetical protein